MHTDGNPIKMPSQPRKIASWDILAIKKSCAFTKGGEIHFFDPLYHESHHMIMNPLDLLSPANY